MNFLLWLNPEFQKNLWLELSPGRLAGMPIVLGLLAFATYTLFNANSAGDVMILLAGAMVILWGSRSAADSVSDEVTARTWDNHRLGARGATGLVLGKLLGGTIYIWYGFAIAGGIAAWIEPMRRPDILNAALCGLLAQSAALFTSFALKDGGRSRRAHNLAAQAVALGTTGLVRYMFRLSGYEGDTVSWYRYALPVGDFLNGLTLALSLWFVIGAIRLVRRELGFRDGPAGWSCFTLCAIAVAAGLNGAFQGPKLSVNLEDTLAVAHDLMPFLVSVAATYLALLGGQAGYGRWSRLAARLRQGRYAAAWTEIPPWVAGAILAFACGAALCVPHPEYAPYCVALMGFLVRDAVVVTGIALGHETRAGSLITLYFLLVDVVAPYLGRGRGMNDVFVPVATAGWQGAAFPWGEALAALVVCAAVFIRLWKTATPVQARAS